jgi:hypothetical protein
MAAENVVSLADRRPPVPGLTEGEEVLLRLMRPVVLSDDPVIAAMFLLETFAGFVRSSGVPAFDVAALAAGEVSLDTLARRHAGLLDRWAEEELTRTAPPGEAG